SYIDVKMNNGGTRNGFNRRFWLQIRENGKEGSEENDEFEQKIVGISGKQLFVPFFGSESDIKFITLIQINSQGIALKEIKEHIKYENGQLVLNDSLDSGQYQLFDWKIKRKINIFLIKPKLLYNSSQHNKQTPYQRSDQIFGVNLIGQGGLYNKGLQTIGLSDIHQLEDGRISVDIIGSTPSTRIHAFVRRFQSSFHLQTLLEQHPPKQSIVIMNNNPHSQYESDKQLGTEQLYILNRR
ncbi:MAG: hypothetical protein EZS28_034934, partial [Streblomastix strix]